MSKTVPYRGYIPPGGTEPTAQPPSDRAPYKTAGPATQSAVPEFATPGDNIATTPNAPADVSAEGLGFDIGQTEGSAVGDITGLLAEDSDYMKQARTRGMQYANSRGLLNSSIGANAAESAAIDAALPIMQTQSGERTASRGMASDLYRQDDAQQHDLTLMENEFNNSLEYLNVDTAAKDHLIGLEQQYNLEMTNNTLMAETWQSNIEGINKIFTSGMTNDQQASALDFYFGEESANGSRAGGALQADMNFTAALFGDELPPMSGTAPTGEAADNYNGASILNDYTTPQTDIAAQERERAWRAIVYNGLNRLGG